VVEVENNDQGVWVAGNARDASAFSATVQLLTATAGLAGACVYASNYPPVGEYKNNATEISFTGTPDYEVILERNDKSTYTATVGKNGSLLIPNGEVALSFTDKTGAPGKLSCMPSTPYNLTVSATTYCAGSSVTFALSNTTSGRTYWLYKGDEHVNTLTSTGGAATFTSAFAGAGVYMAQVIAESGNCAATMTGEHTVSESPLPTITHSGGSVSQSVDWYTAISAMTYTASDAAVISKTGGDFPAGVTGTPSGTPSGASYTISGMPTEPGTFGYSLTASVNGCTSAAAVGTITVVPTPPGAASTQTWVVGTQTWSAPLQKAQSGCTSATDFGTTNPPTVAYYRASGLYSGSGYLYNWKCVNDYVTQLCPTPWRVPTKDDFITLDKAFNGDGTHRFGELEYILSNYDATWGATWGGFLRASGYCCYGNNDSYWSSTVYDGDSAFGAGWDRYGSVCPACVNLQSDGFPVRCVK
jgi:uncharacterized protein (TIGR02145 family)